MAEIKMTTPYLKYDLGAMQKATFAKDFAKLQAADSKHKFFFVTNPATFAVVQRRYAPQMPEITFVLLGSYDGHEDSTPTV